MFFKLSEKLSGTEVSSLWLQQESEGYIYTYTTKIFPENQRWISHHEREGKVRRSPFILEDASPDRYRWPRILCQCSPALCCLEHSLGNVPQSAWHPLTWGSPAKNLANYIISIIMLMWTTTQHRRRAVTLLLQHLINPKSEMCCSLGFHRLLGAMY